MDAPPLVVTMRYLAGALALPWALPLLATTGGADFPVPIIAAEVRVLTICERLEARIWTQIIINA